MVGVPIVLIKRGCLPEGMASRSSSAAAEIAARVIIVQRGIGASHPITVHDKPPVRHPPAARGCVAVSAWTQAGGLGGRSPVRVR